MANALIRAGFNLTLEDEGDLATKHCEFAAVSRQTGKKYWVEAKMRSVAGILCKTEMDGGPDRNPTSQLIPHLNAALKKPASDERLIFIDLNAPFELDTAGKPSWLPRVTRRLERFEREELPAGVTAYVFVTNIPFHRQLDEEPRLCALPHGLGLPDFNRPGHYRLSQAYRQKQKHIDAYHIADSFSKCLQFPTTFDGGLPSEAFGVGPPRIQIGETYFFDDGDRRVVGTVTSATISETEKVIYFALTDANGNTQLWREPISDAQLADYKAHPDSYFGRIVPVSKKIEDRFQFFEWLMDAHRGVSREQLLERMSKAPHFDSLKTLSDGDLLAEYCEAMVPSYEAAGFKLGRGQ